MDLTLSGQLGGSVAVPPSKSMLHRMLICAALADGPSYFNCTDTNDDVELTADCLRALGATIKYSDGVFRVWPIEKVFRRALLDCGESGSTLRFLLPVAAVLEADATFTAGGRLPERPISPLTDEMSAHGVQFDGSAMPLTCSGRLLGGDYSLAANVSSQFISGLLMALPLAEEDSTLTLEGPVESVAYIDMTVTVLRHFGVTVERIGNVFHIRGRQTFNPPARLQPEGDWSAAAFWLVAGCIGSEKIECTGVSDTISLQGDRAIVNLLQRMGAEIRSDSYSATAYPSVLEGTQADFSGVPDLMPAMAVAAAAARGKSVFTGIRRLRMKESDRVEAVCQLLAAAGIRTEATEDSLTIYGGAVHACTADSAGDHRIAMAAAVLSTVSDGPITLHGAECVSKSYPAFFTDFRTLGGRLS